MTNDELVAEVKKLREDVQTLATAFSGQMAQADATGAALLGLLSVVGGVDVVQNAIHQHLERRQAIDLGEGLNQHAVDGFQEMADLIRQAMASAPPR